MNTKNNLAIFTVCNLAYLNKALVLADSVRDHCGSKLIAYIFDKKCKLELLDQVEIVWIEDLDINNFKQLAFKYDVIELTTALKPLLAQRLLANFDKVIFLDPDTHLYSSLSCVTELLDRYPIILTPHYTTPQPSSEYESDLPMMRFGSFNLGFFAVRNDIETHSFLSWWNQRCMELCFMESQSGLSVDQKWISIAPCFFKNIHITFNLGLNVAAWNTFERYITVSSEGIYIVNQEYPLIFFHFSNFKHEDPGYMLKRATSEKGAHYPSIEKLGREYSIKINKYSSMLSFPSYAYDYFSDGTYISPPLRKAYACMYEDLDHEHDPFDANGPVMKFAKKNHLYTRGLIPYSYPTHRELPRYRKQIWLANKLMRLILFLIGPHRFNHLSRFLIYLSVYRKNRDLWQI